MDHIVVLHKDSAIEHVESLGQNPLQGKPVTHVWRCFIDAKRGATAGIWSCERGSFEITSHTSIEICTILEGEATIEHTDGSMVVVKSGDSFVIPFGAHTIWHVDNFVKKSFMCCIPSTV